MGITASLALDPCFFSCRRLAISLRNPGDRMGIALAVCLLSRLLLTSQHAESLFNTHIQFLINWLASNFCICENAWDPHPKFACILAFFSLRSPGDRVRSTLIVGRISRFLLSAKLRYYMQACIHFDGSMDGPLAKALIRERSGDAGLLVSEILQYLAAMRTWHFFYFVALVTD